MKVALVLFEWFAHGGLQRDCRRIAEALVARQVSVDILCLDWQGDCPEGVNAIRPELGGGSKVARRKAFANFVATQRKQENYTAVLGFNRLPGLDWYFAADTCFAWKTRYERSWFYRLAPRSRQYLVFEKAVFGADSDTRIFMLSPLQKTEYLTMYPDCERRIIDIPPGIARDRMAPENAATIRHQFRKEFSLPDDALVLLQVGTGFPVKGVDRSLAAIAALPVELRKRVRFFVLGQDRQGRYGRLARNLNIASGVTFMEGRNDLPRFYQGADLLLQPSRKESAGMVLLEAIVAGLPVLTTASCGYAFHVTNAEAGMVVPEPFSQQALNFALQSMLDSNEKALWRERGIAYGKTGDFYDMPDHVAGLVLSVGQGATSDL